VSSPRDILQAAIDECARIDTELRAARVDVLAQRRAALDTIPAAASALRAHDKSVRAAHEAWEKKVEALRARTVQAEAEAPGVREAGEWKATAAWQTAVRKADDKKAAVMRKVAREYEDARDAATAVTGPALDARRRNADRARDAGLVAAERDHRDEVQAAWVAYQSARLEAQDAAVARVESARQDEEVEGSEAAVARDMAIQKADDALAAALAGVPLTTPILEAFAARLAEVEARAEAAKAAAMAHL
jgi:hypothetical protein